MSFDSIDISLDNNFQPIVAAGDFELTSEKDGLIQIIRLEAFTQEGELFYDKEYGWSLYDFIHVNHDELVKVEIYQRCKTKMSKYEFVNQESIDININFADDGIKISVGFKLLNYDEYISLTINLLDRVEIEVN